MEPTRYAFLSSYSSPVVCGSKPLLSLLSLVVKQPVCKRTLMQTSAQKLFPVGGKVAKRSVVPTKGSYFPYLSPLGEWYINILPKSRGKRLNIYQLSSLFSL